MKRKQTSSSEKKLKKNPPAKLKAPKTKKAKPLATKVPPPVKETVFAPAKAPSNSIERPSSKTTATPIIPQQAIAPEKPLASVKKTTEDSTKTPTSIHIPSILMEGDHPLVASHASGPGQRYSLGPKPPTEHFAPSEEELPEAYGTMQLFLTARDPHWLYAAWDLTREQLKKFNSLSAHKHLILRVYATKDAGTVISEIHVHPESRNWFVPVPTASMGYLVELGYYDSANAWTNISLSSPTLTPPDTVSEDTNVRFATIPADVSFEEILTTVRKVIPQQLPLIEAVQQLREQGHVDLPVATEIPRLEWTPAQEQALAKIVTLDQIRRVWIGSLEITELVRRQLEQQVSSLTASQLSRPTSPGGPLSSLSSPFGGMPAKRKGFWFNVNAELIIYGATEPDAKVSIGDRPIRLRPDGSFSFRFALPDGEYSLPAVATSADGDDTRAASLQFSRKTDYTGIVGKHPQDAALKPPTPDAVS